MESKVLLGIKRFKSKKGVDFVVLQISKPFNVYEVNNGSEGRAVEEVWINEPDLQAKVSDLKLDKPISIDYDVNNGRPIVVGFKTLDK